MLSSTLFLALFAFQTGQDSSSLLLPLATPEPGWTYRAETDAVLSKAGFELSTQVVGSSRVDLQACKLEYSIVSPK